MQSSMLGISQVVLLLAALAAPSLGFNEPNCAGDRTVIVHLFNWKWTDIALECERFLGPKGFCGVQVSPVNEHRIVTNPERPWWERYQPVSYLLESRSGTDEDFTEMVARCNAVDVKIYVDMVVNHMAGADAGEGIGSGGSYYNTATLEFPGVPYSATDFNCCNCDRCTTGSCNIENYGDVNQVRNCRLVALVDLDPSREYVRDAIAGFFNHLIRIGVAGFRVDACKHMWPGDIEAIYSRLDSLNEQYFPANSVPFIFNEVIDMGGEPIGGPEYTHLGRVTEFRYGIQVGQAFRRQRSLKDLIYIQDLGMLPSDKALVFVDNHDNQRGHGGGGNIITFYQAREYKLATAFKLAHPYGFARIMSSYSWPGGPDGNDWWGPPRNPDWSIKDVPINADGSCGDDWVCEHRWRVMTNMAMFRNVAGDAPLENAWDNGNHQIAFSRGNRAFIVINNEEWGGLDETLYTGLPGGTYCDVISGEYDGNSCTGGSISVDESGSAHFSISNDSDEPVIAIHVNARHGGPAPTGATTVPGSPGPTTTRGPTPTPPEGYQRTVVFINFNSQPGQDVFVRGGINHDHRPGCVDNAETSACAIAITHNDVGSGAHYEKYNAWKVGDTKLDWYGAQVGQGTAGEERAEGSPTVWTSNVQSSPGYQPLNKYGDHYWMVDVNMDCDQTESGWFEVKSFATNYGTNGGWEFDINQASACGGDVGGSKPYTSNNHFARCGYVNVFTWSSDDCTIEGF